MTEIKQLREQVTRLQAECNILLAERRLRDWQGKVRQFHEKYGGTVGDRPAVRDWELRVRLVLEEALEFAGLKRESQLDYLCATAEQIPLPEQVDGLIDLIYVCLGALVAYGVNGLPLFSEVHRSNMTKDVGEKRDDGKIVKGESFEPPRIAELLVEQGWNGRD